MTARLQASIRTWRCIPFFTLIWRGIPFSTRNWRRIPFSTRLTVECGTGAFFPRRRCGHREPAVGTNRPVRA